MTARTVPLGPGATAWEPETVTTDPYNAQTPIAALAEPVTPVGAFFVRDHFGIPGTEPRAWRLRFDGAVAAPFELCYDDLSAMDHRELDVVLECAGNGRSMMTPRPPGLPWDQRAVGCARFAGVPFRTLAARALIRPDAVEIVFAGADAGTVHDRRVHFERSLPLAVALHPDTLLATRMNGEPLAAGHGAPVRLVVPGRYAVADVKWLVGVRAVTEPFTGVFQAEEYVYEDSRGTPEGPVTAVRVKSIVTAPEPDTALRRDHETVVRGRAWSGGGFRVRRVEVKAAFQDDGPGPGTGPHAGTGPGTGPGTGLGPRPGADPRPAPDGDRAADWQEAELEPPAGPYAWTGWSFRWTPRRPGPYRLLARASDTHGDTQPARPPWNARGYGCNPVASVDVVVV